MARKRRGVRKTAISVSSEVLDHVHRMVKQGVAPSVSGYFSALATRDQARRELLDLVGDLESELGMTDADRQRLDLELGLGVRVRAAGASPRTGRATTTRRAS